MGALILASVLIAGFALADSSPTMSAPTSSAVNSDLAATASAVIKIQSHFGDRRRCLRWAHYYNSYRRCVRWADLKRYPSKKRRPIDPRGGGPQPDPPGRR